MGMLKDGLDILISIFRKFKIWKKEIDDEELEQKCEDTFEEAVINQRLIPIMSERVTDFEMDFNEFSQMFSNTNRALIKLYWETLHKFRWTSYCQSREMFRIIKFEFSWYVTNTEDKNRDEKTI